jgi:polyhydroxyalkanoate synthase
VRHTYLENALSEPGGAPVLGVPVDLEKIAVPSYVLATREDHIVPWRTAYRTTQLLDGEMRFVLGASGHIAGVINPAAKGKRSFWTGEELVPNADAWLATAREKPGSWWSDWSGWLARFGGERVRARTRLGSDKFKPIEPAPGRYVKFRVV